MCSNTVNYPNMDIISISFSRTISNMNVKTVRLTQIMHGVVITMLGIRVDVVDLKFFFKYYVL